jgi:hypothetical protein
MQPKDKIIKCSWNLMQSIQDCVNSCLMSLIKDKKINFENITAEQFLQMTSATIAEGFHKSLRSFEREIDDTLTSIDDKSIKKK